MFNGPFAGQDSGLFLVKLKYIGNERAIIEEVRALKYSTERPETYIMMLQSSGFKL